MRARAEASADASADDASRVRRGMCLMPDDGGKLSGRCPDCEPITRAALLGAGCAQFNCERDLRMKIDWKKLIVCLAVPLAVGGLAAR